MNMNGLTKFCIGGAASALLAWGYHTTGAGADFINGLSQKAEAAIGDSPVAVRFGSGSNLNRIATLSGDIPEADRAAIEAKVLAVSGISAVRWADDLGGKTASDNAASDNGVSGYGIDRVPNATDGANSTAAKAKTDTAATPPASAETVGKCQRNINALLANRTITFRSGSAYIAAPSNALLDELAGVLKPCAGTSVEIGGHSDASGAASINTILSAERAKRVKDALVKRGVPADRLSAKGYGASQPKISGNPGAAANRRIEFSIASGAAISSKGTN